MAVEAKRGCGYRKVGGTYLVGGGIGVPCDRLPIQLDICPACGGGIKQTRGWTWIKNLALLIDGSHKVETHKDGGHLCPEAANQSCTLCAAPQLMGKVALLWIGEQFYKTPGEFIAEGVAQGFSRRIATVPKDFVPGKTYVLLAHPKAVRTLALGEPEDSPLLATAVESPEHGLRVVYKPGIFYAWLPQRIEHICTESQRGTEEVAALEKRGIVPVFVPDNDPDHQGTAYDKKETDEAPETEGPLFGK